MNLSVPPDGVHIVFLVEARAQEVAHVVVGAFAGFQHGTPTAAHAVLLIETERAGYVFLLDFGNPYTVVYLYTGATGYDNLSALTALGRNQYYTVGGLRTVEGRCGGTLQHGHVFNIVGVDVAGRCTTAPHGHTVDDEQRLVVLSRVDGRNGTDDDLRAGIGRTTASRYRDTGDFSLQGVDEVGRLSGGHFVGIQALHGEIQFFLLFADTHGRYDHLFQPLGGGALQRHIDNRLAVDLNRLCLHAYIAEREACIVVDFNRIFPV